MRIKSIILSITALIVIAGVIYIYNTHALKNVKVEKNEQPNSVDTVSKKLNIQVSVQTNEKDTIVSAEMNGKIKDTSSNKNKKRVSSFIIAYYFHPTARCTSCINIEHFSKDAVESVFKKENKTGKIIFKSLNIEDTVNEHFVTDYDLTSSSLVLVLFRNNKQAEWLNLDKVWTYWEKEEEFINYVKPYIKEFLKKAET